MKIAVASGKGGTGKTTLSVALALVAPQPVMLLDCDVEEPNCHIFLKLEAMDPKPVTVAVPEVDTGACTACGECMRLCQFNAIISFGAKALVFPELCHSCGGCTRVCANAAISEIPQRIGTIDSGTATHVTLIQGRLDVGHAMATPLIRAVKRHTGLVMPTIIDCPPGTSCPMITAVRGADFVILVTEPTPFGLHDLTLAVETVRALGIPFGVIVNRSDTGDSRVADYCLHEEIPVLLSIPENRRAAEAYSRGESILSAMPDLTAALRDIWRRMGLQTGGGGA